MDRWLLSITPALLRMYPYNYLINLIAKQIAIRPSAQEYALETLKNLSKGEIADIMMAVYTGLLDYEEDIRLDCPVLIAYGEKDKTGKVISYSIRWAAEENRELLVIPNAAHNANMDNPEAFNELLKDFLVRTTDA
jgi:pimeloyl-ACP methyl ester carboxylesterase